MGPGEATHEGVAVHLFELVQFATVQDSRQHLAHIELLPCVDRHQATHVLQEVKGEGCTGVRQRSLMLSNQISSSYMIAAM